MNPRERGAREMARISGRTGEGIGERLGRLSSTMEALLVEQGYGKVYASPELSRQFREDPASRETLYSGKGPFHRRLPFRIVDGKSAPLVLQKPEEALADRIEAGTVLPGMGELPAEDGQKLFPKRLRRGEGPSFPHRFDEEPDRLVHMVAGPEVAVGEFVQAVDFTGLRVGVPLPSSPGAVPDKPVAAGAAPEQVSPGMGIGKGIDEAAHGPSFLPAVSGDSSGRAISIAWFLMDERERWDRVMKR